MWERIVGLLVVLIILSFAIQWALPRKTRGRKIDSRRYWRWDIAPIIGFFGLVLLALAFVEAFRQTVLTAWAVGSGAGLLAGASLWLAWRPLRQNSKREAAWRVAWRFIRTYGLVFVVVLLGLNIGVRFLGAALEVFVAAAAGIVLLATAMLVFVRVASSP